VTTIRRYQLQWSYHFLIFLPTVPSWMRFVDLVCCCLPKLPKYEYFSWDELPNEAREAAEVLGYTQHIWDKNRTPEIIKGLEWDQLSEEQKQAASVLGYDQALWDDDEEE
jgi:hypothetical protein